MQEDIYCKGQWEVHGGSVSRYPYFYFGGGLRSSGGASEMAKSSGKWVHGPGFIRMKRVAIEDSVAVN